jgi:hypothetical protein
MEYEVGDTITYQTFGGGYRTVVVIEKHENVKNGEPGFDGAEPGGDDAQWWGYDHQIVRVEAAA